MIRFGLGIAACLLAGCGGGGGGNGGGSTIPPNLAPVFSAAQSTALHIAENTVAIDIAVSDPEGAAVALSLSGSDAAAFNVNASARQITPKKQLDFERPDDQDTNNTYELTVTASDGALSASKSFTLTVADVFEALENGGAVALHVTLARRVFAAAAMGDVDQDGRADVALGAHGVLPGGETYVLTGAAIAALESRLNTVTTIASRLTIKSSQPNATSGGVLAAGDTNGDQRAELLIGEPFFYSDPFAPTPRTVAVRGSDIANSFGDTLDPVADAARVARIDGAVRTIAVTRDIDGDTLGELAVANPAETIGAISRAGVLYLVRSSTLNGAYGASPLPALTSSVLRILGPSAEANLGKSVAPLQDFDGDGAGDLLVAAPGDTGSPSSAASAFLFTGPALSAAQTAGVIDLSLSPTPPAGVIRFNTRTFKSMQVAAAGDINGDGRSDILIGTSNKSQSFFPLDLTVGYLFFGQSGYAPVQDLSQPATLTNAVVFTSIDPETLAGFGIASAGDVDNDGRPDILVSDILAGGTTDAGAVYLIFSSALQTPGMIVIENIAADGIGVRISGAHRGQNLFAPLGPVGDVNGDGMDDIVLAGNKINDTTDSRFFVLSGKMLTAEKTQDRMIDLAVVFPELVAP